LEYYPNGQIKVIADFIANGFVLCGKYHEYDPNGKLTVKGQYELISKDNYLPENRKKGIWKYYKNGKCIKKEKMPA
jgi:antitoxin component YwqK of YwqJK toxin-antitoxin module